MARYFGEIRQGEMIHNLFGLIAMEQWNWILKQYPYLISHAFVVMPDHVHGVLEINRHRTVDGVATDANVGTGRDLSLPQEPAMENDLSIQKDIPFKVKPLSQIIGAYKTTVSKKIHLVGGVDFVWQRSFFDRIIRNKFEYQRVIEYIHSNPANWNEHEEDK